EYQHPLSTVDPLGRLAGRSGAAIIVHDEEDRFAPHGDSLRATPNLFATVASALDQKNLNIHDAQIMNSRSDYVLDTFVVLEPN
nr:hypothetical protein [Aeromonas dhakensis]